MDEPMIQTTFRRPRGCTYSLCTPRPVGQNVMDNVAGILRTLRDRELEALVISFTDREMNENLYDGMECLEGLHGDSPDTVEVNAYYRRENEEETDTILEWYGGELPADEAVEFFRRVLMDCALPEEMEGFERKWQKMS